MTDTTDAAIAAEPTSTALVPVEQRAALALNSTQTEQHLRELAAKHREIAVIKDKAGRDQAHGAGMELKRARTAIEKVSKDARDDATKFSKAVIAEEKRLIGIIASEEDRLFAIRDAWDAEQERIRQEKVLAEQRRVDAITADIAALESIPVALVGAPSDAISAAIAELESRDIVEEFYAEFTPKAVHVRSEALEKLAKLHADAIAREAEAARIAEEQARLAAEREELERQRRELQEAQARAAAEAAAAAQRMVDEANAKARREAAEREAFLQQQQDAFEAEKRAAEDALADERRRLAEEQARIAAQVKAQQEAEAAARREREAAERKAREEEELILSAAVEEAVVNHFRCGHATASDYILRAAAVITARRNNIPEVA